MDKGKLLCINTPLILYSFIQIELFLYFADLTRHVFANQDWNSYEPNAWTSMNVVGNTNVPINA